MTHRFHIDSGGDVWQCVPRQQDWDTARVLNHFHPALHFGSSLGQGLAMFSSHQGGQVFRLLFDQLPKLEHHPGALDNWRLIPGWPGASGSTTAAVSSTLQLGTWRLPEL